MITILEGPDEAGKTTLAGKLAALWKNAEVVHTPQLIEQTWTCPYYAERLLHWRGLPQPPRMILDRWIPSEIVYADHRKPIETRGMRLTLPELRLCERLAWSLRPVVVYVRPTDDVLEARWFASDAPFSMREHREILDAYDAFPWPFPGVGVDPQKNTPEDLTRALHGIRPHRQARGSYGIEHDNALRLVVDDPLDSELTDALIELGLPERDLFFVEPNDFTKETHCYGTIAIGDQAIVKARGVHATFYGASKLSDLRAAYAELCADRVPSRPPGPKSTIQMKSSRKSKTQRKGRRKPRSKTSW